MRVDESDWDAVVGRIGRLLELLPDSLVKNNKLLLKLLDESRVVECDHFSTPGTDDGRVLILKPPKALIELMHTLEAMKRDVAVIDC